MKGFEKPPKRLADKEVRAVVLEAVNAITLAGGRVTIGAVLVACKGASRARFRRCLSQLIESGALMERSGP